MQDPESAKYRKIPAIVLLIMLTATGIILYIDKSHVLHGFNSLPVGPLIFTGLSTPGCVKIVLQDTSFSFNGSKFTGVIELSLFDESQVVTVEDLIKRHGVSLVCFNKGVQTAIRIMNYIYSLVNLTVDYYRGVPGLQGRDIISMLRARKIGAIAMPTISINLWLYSNGYTYTGTSIVSPTDYHMSMGLDYLSAFEESFKDPFIHIRRGITVIIPPLSELIPKLVKLDLKPVIKNLLEKLSPYALGESNTMSINTMSRCIVSPGDACIYNIWGFPDHPPQFWIDRVIIRYATQSPEQVYYWSWQLFISRYGSAHLISKRIFRTPEDVKAYLNSKAYYHEGLHDMDVIIDKAVDPNPDINDLAWNHTLPKGYSFVFYKPYVINASGFLDTSVPTFDVKFTYAATGAGYKTSGITFLGIFRWGHELKYIYVDASSLSLNIPNDLNAGRKYAALIIPSIMEYLGDHLALAWEVFDYNSDYWEAVPVPVIIPRYIELSELDDSTWQKCYYSANGNVLTPGCTYVTNIHTHLSQLTRYLYRYGFTVLATQYRDLPPSKEVVVDSSFTNRSDVVDYTLAANAFGIFAWMIETLFGGTPINPFLSLISTFISYSDLSFRAAAIKYKLEIRRISDSDSGVFFVIDKLTINCVSYSLLGKAPLAMEYSVYTPGAG